MVSTKSKTPMIRNYKRKLILTKEQSQRIDSWIGVCRMVYNMGLEIKIAAWKNKQESVHKYELSKQITSIRDIDWVEDVAYGVLENAIVRLDNAYKSFYRGAGFPKFASKRKFKSFSFKVAPIVNGNHVKVQKFGWLKIFKDSEITGKPKTATIIKEITGYFICIQCENVPAKFVSENQTIGLDMGLSHFCVDSEGRFIANPKHFAKYERQLRIENRSLSRKKKGFNSWNKQARRLALLHHKIGNVRKDFLHKESTKIAKNYSTVYMEDLNISGMSRNKSLSKYILDAAWGKFRTMIAYKTNVFVVSPNHTSQECNVCGHIDKGSRKSQSDFICTNCSHVENADCNAAKNIKGRGTTLVRQREPIGCALNLKSTDMPVYVLGDLALKLNNPL